MSRFPASSYPDDASFFRAYGEEFSRAWKTIDPAAVEHAAAILIDAYRMGAQVFSCGNGGSASIANHLACDHVKGIRAGSRLFPKVTSLSSNVELLTAIANDLSYEDIFTYQLESLATAGDVLIAISSSGASANIVNAIYWTRAHSISTIALTGFDGGAARIIAEAAIHADCNSYEVIEDVHQAIMHYLAMRIRQAGS